MGHPASMSPPLNLEISPYVGRIASCLVKNTRDRKVRMDSGSWELITEVLSFAAEAEQQLAEQRERITFLESLSATDELTGLANRRGLEDFLARTLAASRRHLENGVLAFVDLDNLKSINDRYGHKAGDKVLRHVANLLKGGVRQSDFVARFGGDEFVLVLVRSDAKLGIKRVRQLQSQLNRSTLKLGDNTIPVAASFGIKLFGPDDEKDALLHAADVAMYADKRRRARTREAN